MEELRQKAAELLESKQVGLVIGYGQGPNDGKIRPVFVKNGAETTQLIYNENCRHNLAVYLLRHELKKIGKVALVAPLSVLRSILQLAAENQITDQDVTVLAIGSDGKLLDLPSLAAIESYVKTQNLALTQAEKAELEKIEKMTLPERWQFWQQELGRCIKCYACRAACPLCYCSRCTIECNQPQWVAAPSHNLGNFEWHITRAMHLAGRCVSCGECGRACPLDIPIDLLTKKMSEDVFNNFGLRLGSSAKAEYALASFKPDDKENFIR
jgi:ferredoxin